MLKTLFDNGKPIYGVGSIAAMVKPSLDHCFFGLLEEVLGMGASKVRGTYQKKNYGQGPHHVPLYIDGVAMHGVARMSRMPIDVVEKVYGCRGGRASLSELSLPRKEKNK